MRLFYKIWFVLAIALLLILSGCTGKDTNTQTGGTPTSEKQTISTTDKEKPAPGSVQAVHFSKLIEFLPEAPSGWTAQEPQGYTNTVESGSWSMANKEFTKGETGRADIGIMDSAYYEVGWFSAWNGIYQWESTDGYAKTTTIKGYPAFEMYSKSSNNYVLYINVKDRFMVYITVDGADKNSMNTLANAINYDGIASLK